MKEEKITIRITRPDNSVHQIVFENCEIRMIDKGMIIMKKCTRSVLAFYPLNYSLEVIEVENI